MEAKGKTKVEVQSLDDEEEQEEVIRKKKVRKTKKNKKKSKKNKKNKKKVSEDEEEEEQDLNARTWIRIVVISDTHRKHEQVAVPDQADILIHCGDFSKHGNMQQVTVFNEWLGTFDHIPIKIVVSGNHELQLYKISNDVDQIKSLFTNAIYLQDELLPLYDGKLKIYGSPWIGRSKPLLLPGIKQMWIKFGFGLGYALGREDERLIAKRKQIPSDIDFLVTHSPPFAVLDLYKYHMGCKYLREEVRSRIKPPVHLFGHCHEGFGTLMDEECNTLFINAALEHGENWHMPHVFDYCLETKEVELVKYPLRARQSVVEQI